MKKLLLLGVLVIALLFPITVNAQGALTSLKVKGIDAELTEKSTWKLTYVAPQNYMIVVAETADPTYVVEGAGQVALEDGENTHIVTVKDATGNVLEEYTLNVTKSTPGNGSGDNPETGMFLNISLIVAGLGIALVAYNKASKNKKFSRI